MSRKTRIENIIEHELQPTHLVIEDESHRHHVPQGLETHFKLIVVSTIFEDQTRINRHRIINKLLAAELAQGLHALSMHLFTPKEWANNQEITKSPACRDGYEH
ncbi:MAG: BolA family transcriptional regulator [Legionella sp. 40-6]|nr:MAG: BolA family transcriptional regulator [Legionella sp. 40-6]